MAERIALVRKRGFNSPVFPASKRVTPDEIEAIIDKHDAWSTISLQGGQTPAGERETCATLARKVNKTLGQARKLYPENTRLSVRFFSRATGQKLPDGTTVTEENLGYNVAIHRPHGPRKRA